MGVPGGVWVAAVIIAIVLVWMTIWVTNKAYSRKWDDHHDEQNNGEFK